MLIFTLLAFDVSARVISRIVANRVEGAAAPLDVGVRSGRRRLRLQNLTNETWTRCVVTVEGNYTAPPFDLGGHQVVRIPYDTFVTQTMRLRPAEGFSRAFHRTTLQCTDPANRPATARVQ